jgi:hypothetical protein
MTRNHPNVTHGRSKTAEYLVWKSMRYRCSDPSNKSWNRYGGKGIVVCEAWREDFPAFFAHVGPRPTPKHTIDRFPNRNGNYEPGNVRWATRSEQELNKDPYKRGPRKKTA